MKKKTIILLILGVLVYAGLIWLVRSNHIARTISKWILGIILGIWGLDFVLGQFAGLISDDLQEKMVAFFLALCPVLLALAPLFVAAIAK